MSSGVRKPILSVRANLVIRDILTAFAATAAGFALLNLTFMLDALFQHTVDAVLRLVAPAGAVVQWNWFPAAKHGVFTVLVLLLSWLVLRSRLNVFIKATVMMVPLATIYATIGMFLGSRPVVAILLGAVTGLGVLICLCRTKKPWLYFYSLVLISIAMLLVILFDVQI